LQRVCEEGVLADIGTVQELLALLGEHKAAGD
jgi:hypothetical protein